MCTENEKTGRRVEHKSESVGSAKTQENLRAPNHEEYQKEVDLGGVKVWADPELIPLLKALNEAGLTTRSHCCGHGNNRAWVAIKLDNITGLEVRKDESYNEVLVTWVPNSSICGK